MIDEKFIARFCEVIVEEVILAGNRIEIPRLNGIRNAEMICAAAPKSRCFAVDASKP